MATETETKPEGVKPEGNTEPATPNDKGGKPDADDVKAHIHALNEESKKHRLRADALEKQLNGVLGGFKQVFGVSEDQVPEKVKEIAAQKDGKLRSVLLRAAFTEAAVKAGIRDPSVAFKVADLTDVAVDVENESVDAKALETKISALKSTVPYFFAEAQGTPAIQTPAPGRPQLTGTHNHVAQWRALLAAGDRRAAAHYYSDHEKDIQPYLGSG